MKALVGIIMIMVLMAAPVTTRCEPISDGIYLATTSGEQCATVEYLQYVTMQVIAVCPSQPEIWGYEVGLVIDNRSNTLLTPSFPFPVSWMPDPFDPVFFDVTVGFPSSLVGSAQTVLTSIDILYLDPGPIYFHLAGSRPSSLEIDRPAYLAGLDPETPLVPLTPLPTGTDYDFALNPTSCDAHIDDSFICGPVPNQKLSWGAIKSLYR